MVHVIRQSIFVSPYGRVIPPRRRFAASQSVGPAKDVRQLSAKLSALDDVTPDDVYFGRKKAIIVGEQPFEVQTLMAGRQHYREHAQGCESWRLNGPSIA